MSSSMETESLNAPGGVSGNDDAGTMSAWYVFSAMGFYPVCPGTPYYIIGSPSFPGWHPLGKRKDIHHISPQRQQKKIYISSHKTKRKRI